MNLCPAASKKSITVQDLIKGIKMTGEVKLLTEVHLGEIKFGDLKEGEGTTGKDGTRIKVKFNHYLRFRPDGAVFLNHEESWPFQDNREVREFRLIAEEI